MAMADPFQGVIAFCPTQPSDQFGNGVRDHRQIPPEAPRCRQGEPWREAGFCCELPLLREDWPDELGDVAWQVTLIHGEQDGTAPFETALHDCAMYPASGPKPCSREEDQACRRFGQRYG